MKVPSATVLPEDSAVGRLDTQRFKLDGTTTNSPLLSEDQRALAAGIALIAGGKAAEEVTGVSANHAAVLARGEYSKTHDPEERERRNQKLRDDIYEGLGKIRAKARGKLLKALNLINDETLEAIPDKDKARIAAQMANQLSGVIDRTINKGEHVTDGRSSHLHLYAPEQRPLAAFDVKRINPKEPDNANAKSIEQ